MTVMEAWLQMCENFLEDDPEAEGLVRVVEAISGGYGSTRRLPEPLTAKWLADELAWVADGCRTWSQIPQAALFYQNTLKKDRNCRLLSPKTTPPPTPIIAPNLMLSSRART
jgi:hypothetical protein